MNVYPAVDLRDGCCVQLVGGSYENELLRINDPVAVAKKWKDTGFSFLHIIDLDRATNVGSNIETVKKIIDEVKEDNYVIRVGGGIRSEQDVQDLLDVGASSVVVGSKGVRDHDWFKAMVSKFPNKIYIAIEVFEREVKVDGWQTSVEEDLFDLISRYDNLEVAGIFVTAIHKEGLRGGTDVELFSDIVAKTSHKIVASGGVTTTDDIAELSQVGVAEVVLGAALYTNEGLQSDLQEQKYIGRQ